MSIGLEVKKERSVVRNIRPALMPNLFVGRELAREHERAGATKNFANIFNRRVEGSGKDNYAFELLFDLRQKCRQMLMRFAPRPASGNDRKFATRAAKLP